MPVSGAPLTVVVGITGGIAAYKAVGVARGFVQAGHDVHVVVSPAARLVLQQELAIDVDLDAFRAENLLEAAAPWEAPSPQAAKPPSAEPSAAGRIVYHRHDDYFSPIASGSFLTAGMVVCPCSGSTLSGIAVQ